MKNIVSTSLLALVFILTPAHATVDDARSFALEAAAPLVLQGFAVRQEHWAGDLPAGREKTVVHQLFKGNEYWFFLAADAKKAQVSLHIYDMNGNLAEEETWVKSNDVAGIAAAYIVPKRTGAHYLVITVEKSPQVETHWSMVYAYR